MWKELIMEDDPDWIVEALERGSLHCVTDGSHNPKLAPHISGAAWVLRCSHSNNELQGDFSEQSSMADSYRAEQLGMLAIHLLLLTAEEYYQRTLTDANIFCDNQGTIITFSKEHQRVPSGARNSDILGVLRRIQASSKLAHKLKHVKAHQDDNLPLHMSSAWPHNSISAAIEELNGQFKRQFKPRRWIVQPSTRFQWNLHRSSSTGSNKPRTLQKSCAIKLAGHKRDNSTPTKR